MSGPGSVSIADAIESIQSERLKQREGGLEDLKHILNFHRKNPGLKGLERLEDVSIHTIFDVLFRVASSERSVYVKAGKANLKSASATRLSSCAAAIRLAAETTARLMRQKTVKAVIGHIIQALPTSDGFCQPLCVDYLKTLRAILAHQAHVEHFLRATWFDVVDFCNNGLHSLRGVSESSAARGGQSVQVSFSSHVNGQVGKRPLSTDAGQMVVEFLECLGLLCEAPNSPLLDRAGAVRDCVVDLLQNHLLPRQAQQAAFGVVNVILPRLTLGSSADMSRTVKMVIPLMKSLWPEHKASALRDEMLLTLIYCKSHLVHFLQLSLEGDFVSEVEQLFEAMRRDYFEHRADRGHLELDDLRLQTSRNISQDIMPMQNEVFSLRKSTLKSEHNWTMLHFLAFFSCWLDKYYYNSKRTQHEPEGEAPTKRRRIASNFEECLNQLSSKSRAENVYSVQLLAFELQQRTLTEDQVRDILEKLLNLISNEQGLLSSWALIAISVCAFQPLASSMDLDSLWRKAAQLSARLISSASTSRAASFVMHILLSRGRVNFPDLADSIEPILSSAALNGPAHLSDAALAAWSTMLEQRANHSPGLASSVAYDQFLNWIFIKWRPSGFENRQASAVSSRNVSSIELAAILVPSLRSHLHDAEPIKITTLGSIGQAWLFRWNERELASYVLLLDAFDWKFPEWSTSDFASVKPVVESSSAQTKRDSQALGFFSAELDSTLEAWSELIRNRANTVNYDMISVLSGLCLVATIVVHDTGKRMQERAENLKTKTDALTSAIFKYCSSLDCEESIVLAVVDNFTPFLPELAAEFGLKHLQTTVEYISTILSGFSTAMQTRRSTLEEFRSRISNESDEIDFALNSQASQKFSDEDYTLPRTYLTANCHPHSYWSSSLAYMDLVSCLSESNVDWSSMTIPSSFISNLADLSVAELVACRPCLRSVWLSHLRLGLPDAEVLFDHLMTMIAESDNLDRCEVSVGILLDFMIGYATLWTERDASGLTELGAQLYKWVVDTALEANLVSQHVQKEISDMLYYIWTFNSEYLPQPSSPSIRTVIFGLLEAGELPVQYHVSKSLPNIFGKFVLSQHDLIFEDIHEKLPKNLDRPESIALRLLILSHLGSTWKTLLRRCLYHIFETAGVVTELSRHAKVCVEKICHRLRISQPPDLFRLFSAQLLYTWLKSQHLQSIPFEIFSYTTLKDLLIDSAEEITGQCVMRGAADTQSELEKILEVPRRDLVSQSFGRAAAYALAHDSSNQQEQGPSRTSEANLREMVGEDEYSSLMKKHYPVVLGHLFVRLEREDQIEKAIMKRPGYEAAAAMLKAMKTISCSDSTLPASQQPSFKSKHLLDEIERLCRRVKKTPERLWSNYTVCLVARMLLDDLNPAFGPLHGSRVIKRLRIMICLAGSCTFKGYALELLLHALGQFVTNGQCADDAIGVFQFLTDNGHSHLSTSASFVASVCLSTFLSLRLFLNSTHDSTTQESQHQATLERARSFHAWLCVFVESYEPAGLDDELLERFKAIMESARRFDQLCSARKDEAESSLLLQMLQDAQSQQRLLDPISWDSCFGLLCKLFSECPPFRLDVLGDGHTAGQYTASLWQSSRHPRAGLEYRKWAVRSLGRAFAHEGSISEEIAREGRLKHDPSPKQPHESHSTLLGFLVDRLRDEETQAVGAVEETLRKTLSLERSNSNNGIVLRRLPEHLVAALMPDHSTIPPHTRKYSTNHRTLEHTFRATMPYQEWAQSLATTAVEESSEDCLLAALLPLFQVISGMAEDMLPCILHLVLINHQDRGTRICDVLSSGFNYCFENSKAASAQNKLLLNCLLYLHSQPFPREATHVNRKKWLQIDYLQAAAAARDCHMFRTSLYFLELSQTFDERTSRRASTSQVPSDLLLSIYREIDEPDSFYGVPRPSNLNTVADRLDFEGNSIQSLLFRGAQADSAVRSGAQEIQGLSQEIVRILTDMNLNNLTRNASSNVISSSSDESADSLLNAAIKLRQWDVSVSQSQSTSLGILYRTFQSIHNASMSTSLPTIVDQGLLDVFDLMKEADGLGSNMRSSLRALAALTEVGEVLDCSGMAQIEELLDVFHDRQSWMANDSIESSSMLLTSRETMFSMIKGHISVRSQLALDARSSSQLDVVVNLQSAVLYRHVGAMQESLATVTYLNDCIEPCKSLGVLIDGAVKRETADALWERQELDASIRTLQDLQDRIDLDDQTFAVNRAGLLATLGSRVSDARLERPDEILHNYLAPALEVLGERSSHDAGEVHHKFASYCHDQLRNPDSAQEFIRSAKHQEQKLSEIKQLEDAMRSAKTEKEKNHAKAARIKAKQWFELDQRDHKRLRKAREQFLQQSLENYLKCLANSDSYDTDALRFVALWLEYSKDEAANKLVSQHLPGVPSHKFASLLNQLASRVQDEDDVFQSVLQTVVQRICSDHPYHGMHHIFAGSKTSGGSDRSAISRNAATVKIAQRLQRDSKSAKYWNAINKSDNLLNELAKFRSDEAKQGAKVPLRKFDHSRRVERDVPTLKVPPVTTSIPIRTDLDYSSIAYIVGFKPEMTIPSGVSAPKILTAITSEGTQHTQLYKGGQDDLRQDAIMEQVFALVTDLLETNKSTRRRKLRIRTYKVVPLDATSGAIEFVQPTMPLNDFLVSAHPKYHPQEYKWSTCRKKIEGAHDLEPASRISAYKDVAHRFTPVLRHFFFERFQGPDEWFDRRLAYTRSTAAISILGHVLGLGDRHCQNILLDTETGEVIHIDLGVAFEAGRVLRYPELVPFRLTRDIVDGFGVLKTEGVFRRCCEFTLEALRENTEAIMTLLNVLRYDPLYSWSVSPLRAKRLQEDQEKGLAEAAANAVTASNTTARSAATRSSKGLMAELKEDSEADSSRKREEEEGGEAGRALGVVERKLAVGLSAAATVNELIQQATDEKNLALLFAGWAAYA